MMIQTFLLIGLLTAGTLAQAQSSGKPADEANSANAATFGAYQSKDKSETAATVVSPGQFCKECAEKTSPVGINDNTNPTAESSTVAPVETKSGADSQRK